MAFFVVGLGEELCKYIVLVLYALRKPSFNEPFDGIVYAVMISLGFAALENVFYVQDILMMMDLVIYYLSKKTQIIKKMLLVNCVEKIKILFKWKAQENIYVKVLVMKVTKVEMKNNK